MKLMCAVWLLLCMAGMGGVAQTPATFANAPTSFDVVSIHLTDPSEQGENLNSDHGQLIGKGVMLPFLIEYAYGVREFQVTGVPRELQSERYDFVAKMVNPSAEPQYESLDEAGRNERDKLYRIRLQSLLADRFHLKVHTVTKELPVFELVVDKSGPKFEKTKGDGGYMHLHGVENGTEIAGKNMGMADLVEMLSHVTGRKVIEQTGLQGRYDFSVTWTPDDQKHSDTIGPSLYTALQEQLGLRLKPAKGPVDVYVVDRLKKPMAN